MKIETREIYKCEHCNKLYQIKGYCEKHEISCPKNPDNFRKCFGCKFLKQKNTTLEIDYPDGSEGKRTLRMFHCDKLNVFLYPPKVEHKGNSWDTGEINEPMRKECDLYVDEFGETLQDLIR